MLRVRKGQLASSCAALGSSRCMQLEAKASLAQSRIASHGQEQAKSKLNSLDCI